MNARIKLLFLLAFSSAMLMVTEFYVILAMSVITISLIFAFRVRRSFLPWAKPLLLVFAAIVLLQYLTFPPAPFSPAGLLWGAVFSLRLFVLVSAVFLFVHTTPMSRIAGAFSFLPGGVSQVFVLSLGLLPNITQLAGNIMRSQKARGVNFRSPNIMDTYMPVMVPLFGKTLQKSEKMALAMQARGYGE